MTERTAASAVMNSSCPAQRWGRRTVSRRAERVLWVLLVNRALEPLFRLAATQWQAIRSRAGGTATGNWPPQWRGWVSSRSTRLSSAPPAAATRVAVATPFRLRPMVPTATGLARSPTRPPPTGCPQPRLSAAPTGSLTAVGPATSWPPWSSSQPRPSNSSFIPVHTLDHSPSPHHQTGGNHLPDVR